MTRLIAIDWGTTSLRAALLDDNGQVLDEHQSSDGILHVPPGRFPTVFAALTARWSPTPQDLCLLSGMVGSRQGWGEAPYCACPAGFAEVAAQLTWLDTAPGAPRIAIVPGLMTEHDGVPDVMRGEETQVFGGLDLLGLREGLFVLPGTHSKWVRVRHERIESFATYMTGEFYSLLRHHSLLARTLPADDGRLDEPAFRQGLAQVRASGSLLSSAFSTRTLALFDRLPAPALASYLSGLVIGEELRTQSFTADAGPVVLMGSSDLTRRYQLALESVGVPAQRLGSEATWRGLSAIARTLKGNA